MSLSTDDLRIRTGQFDLELVQELNLSTNKLFDISSLSFCTSLMILNLSSNLISDINPLSDLKSLKVLILNSNLISNITLLSQLYQLNTLELAGNKLISIDAFITLGSLYNLKQLLINDVTNELSNPVCKQPDYFIQVVDMLPMLRNLDRIQINNRTNLLHQNYCPKDVEKPQDWISINIDTELIKHEREFVFQKEKLEESLDNKFIEITSILN
ncbi:hypothetical protein LOD99_14703 [Oopsacas minuta]|uniref:Uncharacterized protein n=1 Tax=Oopsacas minuta TaxID=111878 RepID=A0AAV7KCQ1_9METZ|nr:hypothetical protein LOD99_14703 [Oopsacas minuta]